MNAPTRHVSLAELLPGVEGVPPDLVVDGLAQDSRDVRPGDAFFAIASVVQGNASSHGLRFAEQARAAGAAAILFEPPVPPGVPVPADAIAVPGLRARMGDIADRFYERVSARMDVVGVTGTNGKTSTVQLLAQAWSLRGIRGASIGTLGAGLHGHVAATGFTTPMVTRLHGLFAELHAAGAQAVAMEVSSHALEQDRVAGVHFDVAVFTNLTRDHLDYHGDMAAYGAAKARLFRWPGLKAAAINLDDDFGRALHASLRGSGPSREAPADACRVIGLSSRGADGAAVRAGHLHLDGDGIAFDLVIDDGAHPVRSPLLGRFNVDNLLAVAGALYALGDPPAQIARTLSQLQPVHGRMTRLGGGDGQPLVVIDYAHTPDALEQALTSLRAHAGARLVCVFGCGGERDPGKRPEMAAIAERHADAVIVTDDNPRREDGDAIVAGILAGFRAPGAVTVERHRARAIERAIGAARPGDIVLVAGKGHEPYQEIDGVRHPFDDSAVARAALARAAQEPRA